MALPAIDRLDDAVGAGVERLVVAHHRRRLNRHGWARAYDPSPDGLWCTGDPEPRTGNALEVLVDGEEALPRLEREIAAARDSVLIAGWHVDPAFRLSHDGPPLRRLLADAAERVDVRVLAWAGAPLPLFTPSRAAVRTARKELVDGTRIRMALDSRERPMHCHHEKIVVIDGRVAYLGGIDLTGLGGNRLDSSDHPARGTVGWHDAAARVEGPVVADVAAHVSLRWREATGEKLDAAPTPAEQGGVDAQLVRTVPNGVYDSLPDGDYRVLEAYVRALRSAERLVYLESQFLWAPEVTSILVQKLERPPTDEFRVVVLLPARPNNGADDTRGQLGQLVAGDRERRLLACSRYQRPPADQVYVHAKIGIVDDRWLAIGSANLNVHSFYNDTEACLITQDEDVVRRTRLRLWREHLQRDDVEGETHNVVDDVWRARAEDDAFEQLALLPGVSRRSRALLGPLNGLLVDG